MVLSGACFTIALRANAIYDYALNRVEGNQDALTGFISPVKIQYLAGFYAVFFLLLFIFTLKRGQSIITFVHSSLQQIKNGIAHQINSLHPATKIIGVAVIVLHVAINLHNAAITPITNDEAFTYINYVERGIIAALTLYNEPNNHVFYSVLANLTDALPYLSTPMKLRLPSLAIGFFTLPAFFILAAKLSRERVALLSLIIFSSLYLTAKYHFLARGYGLMMFFFIINLTAAYALSGNSRKSGVQLLFVATAVLGFYTHPAYLIPFLVCAATSLFSVNRKAHYLPLFYLLSITAILTLVLYLPLLTLNGLSAFTSNSGLEKPEPLLLLKQIGGNISGVFTQGFYDLPALQIAGICLMSLGLIVARRSTVAITLLLSILFTVSILYASGSPMFIRNLLWFSVFIAVLIGFGIDALLSFRYLTARPSHLLTTGIFILLFLVRTVNHRPTFNSYYHRLFQAYAFTEALPQDFGEMYSEHTSDYYTILKYNAISKNGKTGKLYRSNFDSEKDYDRVLNIKKLKQNYHRESTFRYEKEYEDDYISLWKIIVEK